MCLCNLSVRVISFQTPLLAEDRHFKKWPKPISSLILDSDARDFTYFYHMTDRKNLICIPGQRLCLSNKEYVSGPGTYEKGGYIYSTLSGVVEIVFQKPTAVVTVHSFNNQTVVPSPGDIVTAKVMTISHRICKCEIKCVGDITLSRPYRGLLRKEDIRSTEKDKVEVYKCFRPGDIILARVLPMTEPHWYQLSTAENELGVVSAYGAAGVSLIPISWTEMQCPKTFVKEPRKVAKVLTEATAHAGAKT